MAESLPLLSSTLTQTTKICGRSTKITKVLSWYNSIQEEIQHKFSFDEAIAKADTSDRRNICTDLSKHSSISLIYAWIRQDHLQYALDLMKSHRQQAVMVFIAYAVYFGSSQQIQVDFLNKTCKLNRLASHVKNGINETTTAVEADIILMEEIKKHKYVQITTNVDDNMMAIIEHSLIFMAKRLQRKSIPLWNRKLPLSVVMPNPEIAFETLVNLLEIGRIDSLPDGSHIDRSVISTGPTTSFDIDENFDEDAFLNAIAKSIDVPASSLFNLTIFIDEDKSYAVIEYHPNDGAMESLIRSLNPTDIVSSGIRSEFRSLALEYLITGKENQLPHEKRVKGETVTVTSPEGKSLTILTYKLGLAVNDQINKIQQPRLVYVDEKPVIFKKNVSIPERIKSLVDIHYSRKCNGQLIKHTDSKGVGLLLWEGDELFRIFRVKKAIGKDIKSKKWISLYFDENNDMRMRDLRTDYTAFDTPPITVRRTIRAPVVRDEDDRSVNLMVVGGYLSDGKRVGKYKGFLLATINNDGEYKTVCRTAHGFTDEELESFSELFEEHILPSPKPEYYVDSSLTPDVWFDGTIVWEVLYYTLSASKTHSAGISLGIPLFSKIVQYACTTLESLHLKFQNQQTAANSSGDLESTVHSESDEEELETSLESQRPSTSTHIPPSCLSLIHSDTTGQNALSVADNSEKNVNVEKVPEMEIMESTVVSHQPEPASAISNKFSDLEIDQSAETASQMSNQPTKSTTVDAALEYFSPTRKPSDGMEILPKRRVIPDPTDFIDLTSDNEDNHK